MSAVFLFVSISFVFLFYSLSDTCVQFIFGLLLDSYQETALIFKLATFKLDKQNLDL